jgi:hypothetical protein
MIFGMAIGERRAHSTTSTRGYVFIRQSNSFDSERAFEAAGLS